VPGLAIGFEHSFIHQVADFLNSLDEKETDRTDFEDAMQTERVVNAVLRSAKSGKWESLGKSRIDLCLRTWSELGITGILTGVSKLPNLIWSGRYTV
jgi:hypothetical protein